MTSDDRTFVGSARIFVERDAPIAPPAHSVSLTQTNYRLVIRRGGHVQMGLRPLAEKWTGEDSNLIGDGYLMWTAPGDLRKFCKEVLDMLDEGSK